MIQYLDVLRKRKEEEAYQLYLQTVGTAARTGVNKEVKAQKATKTTVAPWQKGKALDKRSTVEKTWKFEPANCPHPEERLSKPRGGQGGSAWVTCLDCGQRWERVDSVSTLTVETDFQAISSMSGTAKNSHTVVVRTKDVQPTKSSPTSSENEFLVVPTPAMGSNQEVNFQSLVHTYSMFTNHGLTPSQAISQLEQQITNDAERHAVAQLKEVVNMSMTGVNQIHVGVPRVDAPMED